MSRALQDSTDPPLSPLSAAADDRGAVSPAEPVPSPALHARSVPCPGVPVQNRAELAAPLSRVERVHHLDFLRASMMLFGVFVHASHADYDLGRYELVRFASGSFRMACFFLISGYFCAVMLRRYTLRQFLRRRVLALGVPAVFSVIVLNPPALAAMRQYFSTAPVAAEPTINWHLHVWFLFVMLLYSLGARPLTRAWQTTHALLVRVIQPEHAELLGLALFTAAVSFGLKVLEKWGPWLPAFDQYSELTCKALENLPYFACGLLMQRSPRLFRQVHARPWGWSLAAPVLLELRYWLEQRPITTTPQHLLHLSVDFATAFACSFALLSVAERCARRPRRWVTLTSASAYTIYIVHYLIISLVLCQTQRWGFSLPLRAASAALAALGVGYAVHFGLVERFALAALLLNGRLPPRGRSG